VLPVTEKPSFCVADLPSIFSGEGIGFLDPHQLFFLNGRYPTSSYLWNLKCNKDDINKMEDQFSPFFQDLFGATKQVLEDGFFNGTVFRFPLRVAGMHSDLCQTTYNAQKVRDLFASLEVDAHIMLLFLKSVEKIEVYEKLEPNVPATKIMVLEVGADSQPAVSKSRKELVSTIQERRSGKRSAANSEKKKWIISHYYGGQDDMKANDEISDSLGLLPWVAVALPEQSPDGQPVYLDRPGGHIFCFLPLPLENESPTGFLFHVHGYFAVDQNRRHIKKKNCRTSWDRCHRQSSALE
jgi:sacsin